MLDKIRYVNSRGDVLQFGANGLYVNANDLRDWEWSYETTHGRISNFSRKPITRKLPAKVWAKTDAEGAAIKNQLHDVTQVDLLTGSPGRLYVGDSYMVCFITASTKSNYLTSSRAMDVDLTVAADRAIWYKDAETWFGQREDLDVALVDSAIVGFAKVAYQHHIEEIEAVSYPHGYPYGYPNTVISAEDIVTNDFVFPCDWKITIRAVDGPAANPEINIGAETYKVHYTVGAGGTIEIDSRRRTIVATDANGVETNIFRYRDKSADIFAKIQPGAHLVTWNGDYIFSLTLYQERSEPLWT